MEPTLRQFRYFIAVANTGQISRAAMEINVSQSAVTAAVKSLEEMIGAPLFDRHAGGVTLTYEGNLFLDHARHIVANVEEAIQLPRRIRENVSGSINMAVSYTVAGYFLPPHLARFARGFPNVKLNMTEADRGEIEEGLISGTFDIGVVLTSNIINQEDLSHDTLFRSRRRLWVDAHHRFLARDNVSLQDIAAEPYIMLTVDEASNTAQRYWNRTPHSPNTIFRTASVEAVRSMVANGMGVAILSDMVYRPWSLEGRRVEVIPVADPVPTMDAGFAWSNGAERSNATHAFIEFMHLSMGPEQPMNLMATKGRS